MYTLTANTRRIAVWNPSFSGIRWLLLLLLGLLRPVAAAQAQAPAWTAAIMGSNTQASGSSFTRATALDAAGNVLVAGNFSGRIAFGSTLLTSAGNSDLFVAKYVPSTGTWAWATSGGGTGADQANGLAVSNGHVYLTGATTNDQANSSQVVFGGDEAGPGTLTPAGASASSSQDVVLARYTDQGTSVRLDWVQAAGGTDADQGYSVAVSGTSVYLTGYLTNTTADAQAVRFGTTGTLAQYGASSTSSRDLFVAKYLDHDTSPSVVWTQVGGGTRDDAGYSLAVNGTSLYVAGVVVNTPTDGQSVRFGGSGTTAGTSLQYGAGNADLLVAKYTDLGATAALAWTQAAGGTSTDQALGITVSGPNVYVAGVITNNLINTNRVLFGGSGTAVGTLSQAGASSANQTTDVVVAKYVDAGTSSSVAWTQVGGGTAQDYCFGLASVGNAVYLTGYLTNTAADAQRVRFGGSGTTAGTVAQAGASTTSAQDLLVASYTDNGPTATFNWSQVAGGTSLDYGLSIAASSTAIYAGGYVTAGEPIVFGSLPNPALPGTTSSRAVVGTLSPTTGMWQAVAAGTNGGSSQLRATTTDASGNVLVTGTFTGQVTFGSTVLSSQGDYDLFVAKYVPSTGTWAWAASGGGTGTDAGLGIAVSGTGVYVTGYLTNNTANSTDGRFGDSGATPGLVAQYGASATTSQDVLVVKYVDAGSTAKLAWTQVGGGTDTDRGQGIAVSGANVYVTGYFTTTATNANAVVFGGSGSTAGTAAQYGSGPATNTEVLLAKYSDAGSSATLGWTQVGGGTGSDLGYGVATNGTTVYVTGSVTNNTLNDGQVVFGGSGSTAGTLPQYGASPTLSVDLVLAKYVDAGSTASLVWTQVGGGTNLDYGAGVAVNGSSVYVTGTIANTISNSNTVVFGGTGVTPGTVPQYGASSRLSNDLLVAKYLDNGATASLGWTQVGGGTDTDTGFGIVVQGASVYTAGIITTNTANANAVVFGGTGAVFGTAMQAGASATSSNDLVVVKYTDNGTTASLNWSQVAGGTGSDYGVGLAVSGATVYAAGYVVPSATFGQVAVARPIGTTTAAMGQLVDAAPLPVQLVAFTAQATGPAAVRLQWTTASELRSAYFGVERSADGLHFVDVGRARAAGTSATAHTYTHLDSALPVGVAQLAYRLRQVDLDGTTTYTPVRLVALAGTGVTLFPNPTQTAALLTGVVAGTPVEVLDVLGRVVLHTTAAVTGPTPLALPASLARGVYVVRTAQQVLRLVVQ